MSFEVTLQPSGHVFLARENTQLLSAGLAAGRLLPYSCRQGSCGTCRGRIRSGSVAYGDTMPAYLSEEGRARGEVLLCQAIALSDVVIEVGELEGLAGLKPHVVPCRVTAIERPTPEVAILRVRLPMNENMRFAAGQYVDFFAGGGAIRSFSIATTPTAAGVTELVFHIARLPGGLFTEHVFNTMKLREILRFEGPLGTFFIRDTAKPIILCATGTGFAPIQAMLSAAFADGLHERREITLYYGARSFDGLYALNQAREWAATYPQFRFHPVLSGPDRDRVPEARKGYVQDALLADFDDLSNYEIYACGSPAMVDAARAAATTKRGLPENAFYSDAYLPAAKSAAPIPIS